MAASMGGRDGGRPDQGAQKVAPWIRTLCCAVISVGLAVALVTDWRGSPTPSRGAAASSPRAVPEDAIVFADFPGGGEEKELFLIAPDGSAREPLTNTRAKPESQPAWSPSRREIAYTAPIGHDPLLGDVWAIEVLDVATGRTRTLTAGPLDVAPDWSPDGQWLAFVSILGGQGVPAGSSISLVRADGKDLQPLLELSGTALLQAPAWSPDGRRIAFSVGYAHGGELYEVEVATRQVRRLLAHPGMDDLDPAWSPDGRYVAFASGFYHGAARRARHAIWLLDTVTGSAGTIATHPEYDLQNPAWSPDGREIVYFAEVKAPPNGRWELYVVPAFGGAAARLLTTGVEPDWDSFPAPEVGSPTATLPPAWPTATAESPPTALATNTPPLPPTLPPLPTLPPFPTWVPGEPTATLGTPPTFRPPPLSPTPTAKEPTATATRSVPLPSATATPDGTRPALRLSYLPFVGRGHELGAPEQVTPICLHREEEPNDDLAGANRQPALCSCVPARGMLPAGDREDLYAFTVAKAGAIEAYLLLQPGDAATYELLLYREGVFDPLARGEVVSPGSRDLGLACALDAGRHYLRVRTLPVGAGGSGEYRIVWCRQE